MDIVILLAIVWFLLAIGTVICPYYLISEDDYWLNIEREFDDSSILITQCIK